MTSVGIKDVLYDPVAEWEAEAKWRRYKVYGQTHTVDTIWEGALRAAKKAERHLGKDNCGPGTILNGE